VRHLGAKVCPSIYCAVVDAVFELCWPRSGLHSGLISVQNVGLGGELIARKTEKMKTPKQGTRGAILAGIWVNLTKWYFISGRCTEVDHFLDGYWKCRGYKLNRNRIRQCVGTTVFFFRGGSYERGIAIVVQGIHNIKDSYYILIHFIYSYIFIVMVYALMTIGADVLLCPCCRGLSMCILLCAFCVSCVLQRAK
jgi:hypothetical protein